MTPFLCSSVLTMAVLLPNLGNARPNQSQTPPPPVTGQYEAWQFNDEPIIVNGLIYTPSRETRFFDGNIMSQVGVYRRVPVYADVTLEPHSVIYVPVGRQTLRRYSRRGEAGTDRELRPDELTAVGTSGVVVQAPRAPAYAAPERAPERADVPRPSRTRIESIPRPRDRRGDGIWLEYAGSRWYADGPAAVFDETRFLQIGLYRGFPVYRDKNRGAEEIWVRIVADGPVAPYAKR